MIKKLLRKIILMTPLQWIRGTFNSYIRKRAAWRRFWFTYRRYIDLLPVDSKEEINLYPCINDATNVTLIEPTYFYQDSWAFELIVNASPDEHIDVGSHHKYVALLSKVVSLTMVDIRPLSLELNSINFKEGSILNLPFPDRSIMSLSSLCVIEHIGLGRYGDPLDPAGSFKACVELSRVIAPGGSIYVSVPVEKTPRTYFNAHRSFAETEFLSWFPEFTLKNKAYIYQNSYTSELQDCFGVACYHLVKTTSTMEEHS